MVQIFPFRGYRYELSKVGSLDDVVSDPYDKIDDELQEYYYRKSPYNIVRIIKGKKYPGNDVKNNQYTRAAGYLMEWIESGVLRRDSKPAIYLYDQEYAVPGDGRLTRKGFVALCRLQSYEEGGVRPHERTLAGPKADRLNLMRATKAQFGQVFVLYSDPDRTIERLLDPFRSSDPAMVARDRFSDKHKMWVVQEPEVIAALKREMLDKQIFIADGHHRYETAVAFRDEMRGKVPPTDDYESIENRMLTFVSFEDEGLLILPTHRLVKNISSFDVGQFEQKLGEFFQIQKLPFSDDASRQAAQSRMCQMLEENAETSHIFGALAADKSEFWVLVLKDEETVDRFVGPQESEDYKRLDVVILHSIVLEGILGITKEDLKHERNVEYIRELDEGVKGVLSGEYQLIFVLNPTKVWQVRNVASAGQRMPQKSTDFYPKLLTGLVINKLSL